MLLLDMWHYVNYVLFVVLLFSNWVFIHSIYTVPVQTMSDRLVALMYTFILKTKFGLRSLA